MKIISITTSYPNEANKMGGVFVSRLLEALAQKSQVLVITPAYRGPTKFLHSPNLKVKSCRYAPAWLETLAHMPGGIPVVLKSRPILGWVLLFNMAVSMFFQLTISALSSSGILHANWAFSGYIALPFTFFGKRLVVTLRGDDVTRAKKSHFSKVFLGFLIRRAAYVICVSEDMKNWLVSNYGNSEKIEHIGNGIASAFLDVGKARRFENRPIVLNYVFVGSLIARKKVDFILDGFSNLPADMDWRLRILGEGPAMDSLVKRVEACGISNRVQFLGAIEAPDLLEVLGDSHVFVFASESEGRPNVVVEALATGLIVVAPKIDGVTELIEQGENGFLYNFGNLSEFKHYLESINETFPECQRISAEAVRRVNGLIGTWEESAARYLEIFNKVSGK